MEIYEYDYLIYFAIALVYVYLISYTVDKISGDEMIVEKCGNSSYYYNYGNSDSDKEKVNQCRQLRDEFRNKKFAYMIMIGVASMLAGAMMIRSDESYWTSGLGISLGGLYAVIYYVLLNWDRLDINLRIMVLGAAFASLVYGSIKLSQM